LVALTIRICRWQLLWPHHRRFHPSSPCTVDLEHEKWITNEGNDLTGEEAAHSRHPGPPAAGRAVA
jgi:hypothetical protein